jgi:4-hydroxybenzoate polyprenyltransferase
MGFCRFLLYCLAAAAANSNITPVILQLGAVLGLYVAGITYLARGESKSGKPVYWPMIWLIMPFVVGVETCFVRHADPAYEVLPLLVFGLGQVGWVAWLLDPLWHGTDRSIGRVVSGLLAGIVLVDALLLVPFGGWLGLWVLPFFPLALRLQRVIPAT